MTDIYIKTCFKLQNRLLFTCVKIRFLYYMDTEADAMTSRSSETTGIHPSSEQFLSLRGIGELLLSFKVGFQFMNLSAGGTG